MTELTPRAKANSFPASPAYTTPFDTAGEETTPPPVVGLTHTGWHTFGAPEQLVVPAASKAYSTLSRDGTYSTPFATAGEDWMSSPVDPVHRGWHTFGLPEQLVVPAASKA